MIVGIFFIKGDIYGCSNSVELSFKSDKNNVKRDMTFIAKGCFSNTDLPELDQDVDCLVKYDNATTLACKGFIRRIKSDNEYHIKIVSEFTQTDVRQILARITCLV